MHEQEQEINIYKRQTLLWDITVVEWKDNWGVCLNYGIEVKEDNTRHFKNDLSVWCEK